MKAGISAGKRWTLVLAVLVACIGLDQWTKEIARDHLRGREALRYLGDTLRIQYAENTGAFLGFGNDWSEEARFWTLTVFSGVLLAFVAWFLVQHIRSHLWRVVSLALILAGGIGNLIDRFFCDGRVVDFLNLGVGSLRTGIFNVADMGITFGVIYLFLESFFQKKPVRPAEDSAKSPV